MCIRDRLYVFDAGGTPQNLKGMIGGKIREGLIASNWPDILRIVATMTAGTVAPSQILRKLASYPRQNDLAVALREVGRVERTLFMLDWVLNADMQRRVQIELNKGEAHHALKNALRIGRQGEIQDRTTEGQHYRMAALNLLAAIVIYWNTARLGEAVVQRQDAGLPIQPDLLAHTSPLGWAHILLTGEYKWPKKMIRRTADLGYEAHGLTQCGQTKLMQLRLLLTQHRYATAANMPFDICAYPGSSHWILPGLMRSVWFRPHLFDCRKALLTHRIEFA